MSLELDHNTTYAVVGATGAVGVEMLGILAAAGVPAERVRALSSSRSASKSLAYGNTEVVCAETTEAAFEGVEIALFSCGSGPVKTYQPWAEAAGAISIDNSSAFRMTEGVPLVVPEVNPHHLGPVRSGDVKLIANPNCSTIIMLMAAHPLREAFGLMRVRAATYQAASGAGAAAMDELIRLSRDVLDGKDPVPEIFGEVAAFNVFSHDSAVDPETGMNVEERKMIDETRKIFGDPGIRVGATCVRVPVARAHTDAPSLVLGTPATLSEVRSVLERAQGVSIVDDRSANRFPTPRQASGMDDVLVGRLRPDPTVEPYDPAGKSLGWDLMVSGDQLRKGAALNAVQIAAALQT